MEAVSISLLIAIIGISLSVATFWAGRQSSNKKEGVQNGTMLTEIGYIKSGIDDIKRKQTLQDEKYVQVVERLSKVEASASQAHKRIDRIDTQKEE